MFNKELVENANNDLTNKVKMYEDLANGLVKKSEILYKKKKKSLKLVESFKDDFEKISNAPEQFELALKKIDFEIQKFKNTLMQIQKIQKKILSETSSSDAYSSSLALGFGGVGGVGVVTALGGPAALTSIATTFGVASTGTAISTLTGAASTNAMAAWIGGGALAAGGGGIAAGNVILSLFLPAGLVIAGIGTLGIIATGVFSSNRNKEEAEKVNEKVNLIAKEISKLNISNGKISCFNQTMDSQIKKLQKESPILDITDFSIYSQEDKFQLGSFLNDILALAQLINNTLSL